MSQDDNKRARDADHLVNGMNDLANEDPDLKLAGLSLWVLTRPVSNPGDDWDGNWLDIRARVEAPGAWVEACGPFLRTDDLASFADQLERVQRDLTGDAELACLEPKLNIKIRCGAMRHIDAVISITPDHLAQSHRFTFEMDQSYLAPVLRDCRLILKRFSATGKNLDASP